VNQQPRAAPFAITTPIPTPGRFPSPTGGISFTNSTSTFTDSLGLPSQGSILIINGSGGLSTRVRVGIGVGAAFGGILALIVSSLVFRRWSLRQRSRRTINNNGDTGHSGIINIYPDAPNSESVAENNKSPSPRHGYDNEMSELPPHEQGPRVELD
jgi:hypothetical protein